MASSGRMMIPFDWPSRPKVFRKPLTLLPMVGLPIWLFLGATLRPQFCMWPLEWQNSAIWISGNRAAGTDIASRALVAAGAVQVDPSEGLMMNAKGDRHSPMTMPDYVVYRIPPRPVRDHCNLGGPWGVRLGPRARGSLAQRIRDPKKTPPGASKASPREVI